MGQYTVKGLLNGYKKNNKERAELEGTVLLPLLFLYKGWKIPEFKDEVPYRPQESGSHRT